MNHLKYIDIEGNEFSLSKENLVYKEKDYYVVKGYMNIVFYESPLLHSKLLKELIPAYEDSNVTKEWYLNGRRHREDGPAFQDSNGTKEWWVNGKLHREDGPAVEYSNGTKSWWVNGELHREDGPAYEGSNGTKEWWVNGKRLSKEEFDQRN